MAENNKEIMVINAEKIALLTGYKSEEVAIIKNVIAKNITDTELAFFLSFCKSVDLNPFLKEIWCYQDGQKNLIVFAGRDGFLKKAQSNERWSGMTSAYVCEKDEFEIDIPAGKVIHKFNQTDRKAVKGAYAIIKPKGCDMATVAYADIKEYDKGYSVWKTNKGSMIQKVAETQALKKAFGISGLQSEYDFEVKDNIAVPVMEVKEISELDILKKKIIEALDTYQGEDKEEIQTMCAEKTKANEFTLDFAKIVADQLGVKNE